MNENKDSYAARGVSSGKEEVHEAVKVFEPGLYQNTFCKFLSDIAGDPNFAFVMHADGAGTKSILPYLYYLATGDPKYFRTIVQDALVMNLDDMGSSGIVDNFIISSTIDRNAFNIDKECLDALMGGTKDFMNMLKDNGIRISHAGGETADLGDVVRTLTVNFTVCARVKRSEIIKINIKPGSHVIGLPCYGTCSYDGAYNSGIGANGLTDARHEMLNHSTREIFEAYDRESVEKGIFKESLLYNGDFHIGNTEAQSLIHPTRTYLPLLKKLKDEDLLSKVDGIIHNTGGGQTKVMKFVKNLRIEKRFLEKMPDVFDLIRSNKQKRGPVSWKTMFKTFNMGSRMEIYADPVVINEISSIATSMHLSPVMEGAVYSSTSNELVIEHPQIDEQIIY